MSLQPFRQIEAVTASNYFTRSNESASFRSPRWMCRAHPLFGLPASDPFSRLPRVAGRGVRGAEWWVSRLERDENMLLYQGYVQTLSQRFESALSEIASQHNFELGDEFEIAICKTLRKILPTRFGICSESTRGHRRG